MIANCPCQHCGTPIEFDADAADQFVECPKCHQQTRLLLSASIGRRPTSRLLAPCVACGHDVSSQSLFCPSCGHMPTIPFRYVWQIICSIALANAIFAAIALILYVIYHAILRSLAT